MNDLGNLLQMIYDLLSGWYTSFTSHALAVMEKLNLIETDTASIKISASDIKSNTDDIKDNTGAIITPVQGIKSNTDSIKNDTTTIRTNVTTMSNQLGTISTNVGTASAFTEDVANNTLDIKDRIVTIGSDTTQLRSNSNTITSDVSDIKTALNYYLANTPVTEDVEGSVCNFDTDLADYLQACKVTIPADQTGFTGIILTKCGKNLFDEVLEVGKYDNSGAKTTSNNQLRSVNYIPIKENISLYVYIPYSSIIAGFAVVNYYDVNKIFLSKQNVTSNGFLITTPANACYMTFFISSNYGITYNNDICFNYPDTERTYSRYVGTSFNISFGTTITDGAEINLLDGLIKINSTPVSYQSITPIAVRTYKGSNNIYSDVGTTALTYRETLKHYMDKQEA